MIVKSLLYKDIRFIFTCYNGIFKKTDGRVRPIAEPPCPFHNRE